MARRLRHHVNPRTLQYLGMGPEEIGVPGGREVEVELGCGDGQFLFERAAAHPESLFIGVEIRREWIERIRARAVPNVQGVQANLLEGRARFVQGAISRFFINFPDPLFKRSQRGRRWLNEETARDLRDALRKGGEIFFQSDVFEPALDALAVQESTPGLVNASGEWRFARANLFGARSRREAWCEERGTRIWRTLFRKSG